jgi:hypothetical protein
MDQDKFKHITKRIQIISAIEKASDFGGDIWQTAPDGRRILHILQLHIDIKSDKVVIKAYGIRDLDPKSPIFIRLSYRNIIFKLEPRKFKILGLEKLIFDYPEEMRALETRKGERYVLPFDSQISLSITKAARSISENVPDLEVRIVDVSESGFGILISAANKEYLKKGDHFWIKTVDQRPLKKEISGIVTYVAPKGYYLKRGDVRVGLCLDTPLARDVFEQLKSKCHQILSA